MFPSRYVLHNRLVGSRQRCATFRKRLACSPSLSQVDKAVLVSYCNYLFRFLAALFFVVSLAVVCLLFVYTSFHHRLSFLLPGHYAREFYHRQPVSEFEVHLRSDTFPWLAVGSFVQRNSCKMRLCKVQNFLIFSLFDCSGQLRY